MIKFFSLKMQHGYPKTQNLIIIFNLFKKLQKNTGQKKLLTKKLKKNGVFVYKTFQPVNLWNYFNFSKRFQTQHAIFRL